MSLQVNPLLIVDLVKLNIPEVTALIETYLSPTERTSQTNVSSNWLGKRPVGRPRTKNLDPEPQACRQSLPDFYTETQWEALLSELTTWLSELLRYDARNTSPQNLVHLTPHNTASPLEIALSDGRTLHLAQEPKFIVQPNGTLRCDLGFPPVLSEI